MIYRLNEIINNRKNNPRLGSYTNTLLDSGQDRILQKIGEESTELILAASNQGDQRLIEEMTDLFYHSLVLLAFRNIPFSDIEKEMEKRHSGIS
jgi:phosphoribosyl-ATP pyrophosphohydrolase